MAHSEFSPSQLHRIIQCPSSVQLYRELMHGKESSSSYAEEGTLLHSYMEKALHAKDLSFIPDAEHRAIIRSAQEYIQSQLPANLDMTQVYQETQVTVPGVPQVYGTADLIVHLKEENELHLFDYKFGAGIWVDTEDNPQFMAYMLGAIQLTGADTENTHFYIHVVQPRMDNMRYITVSYDHLVQWRDEVLIPAIAKANSDKRFFGPSESACRFCAVKARCPACFQAAQNAASEIFKLHGLCKESAVVPMEEVQAFFKNVEQVQQMAKAIKEYFLSELRSGHEVPGYKIGYSRGTRKWKDEGEAVEYLEAQYGYSVELFNTELKSPAQMEKLIKGLKKDQTFLSLVHSPQGAPKLIPIDEESADNPFQEVME